MAVVCGNHFEIGPCGGNFDLYEAVHAHVDCFVVLFDDVHTLLEVGLLNGILHVAEGFFHGDDVHQLEECRLQDGVGSVAQTDLRSQVDRVDDVELGVLLSQALLQVCGKSVFQFLGLPLAIQQEHAAVLQVLGQVVLVDVSLVVNGDQVRIAYIVRLLNGRVTETQVRLGEAAALLGVIREVCLGIHVGVVADDLDGVLVCADGTVCTQTPDLAGRAVCGSDVDGIAQGQGQVRNVVHDGNREVVLRAILGQVVVNGYDVRRSGVLGGQAVAAAHDDGSGLAGHVVCVDHVQIHGFADGAGFLGHVEDCDLLASLGHGSQEMLHGEGSVQVDVDHTDLAALRVQVVADLFQRIADGTVRDDDFGGIGCAVVVEQRVIAAGQLIDLVHVVLYDLGNSVVEAVLRFSALEVEVGVDGGAADAGMFGVEGVLAERVDRIHVHELLHVVVVQAFDLLDLVGGPETVEVVQEGHSGLDGGQVGDSAHVHNFLGVGGSQHRETGLAAGHYVGVVSEDGQAVYRQGTGGYVEHAGEQFACDLVHVGDHEQQTLGSGVGRGQRASLQGTVDRTGCTGFGLHLDHLDLLTEDVLTAFGRPFVHHFCHGGAGRDREDTGDFGKCVRYVRRRGISVHYVEFFSHSFLLI